MHPAQFADGGEVTLANGISVLFAFDKNGELGYIASSDPRLEFSRGVGIGSTFEELCRQYLIKEIAEMPGYGTLMRVSPNLWAVIFPPDNVPFDPDSKIKWIEIRKSPDPL